MDENPAGSQQSPPPEEPPFGQKLFDSPFILLALGMVIMVVFFTLWGLWEISSLPQATLP